MNCPSRTDELWLHPDWNQSPPTFAADLTTCQDLNGIANAREVGDAYCLKSGARSLRKTEFKDASVQDPDGLGLCPGKGVKDLYQGSCTHSTCGTATYNYEHQAELTHMNRPSAFAKFKSWAGWLLSVLCTAFLISSLTSPGAIDILGCLKSWLRRTGSNNSVSRFSRRDTCASGGVSSDYDLPFHVGGLFIILFVSATGCGFPLLVTKFPRLRIPASFLFAAKHFGTGVLIATAFVHLLPTAFLSLSDPCLSDFWTTDYPAMPGAIMLASVFFVTLIEMIFSPNQHVCGGSHEGMDAVSRATNHANKAPTDDARPGQRMEMQRVNSENLNRQTRDLGPLQGRAASISRTLSRMREENQVLEIIESGVRQPAEQGRKDGDDSSMPDSERAQEESAIAEKHARKKAVMQCFLLEVGILFHSIFIGMSLSVSVGSEFVILLIAIIFHQTFEGLALGVRIASIEWPENALQPWFMALAYGCTTPLGQALGIATHTLYSPDSQVGLLVVGIMNAISAGFLVFASLVELMSEDFLSDESWQILTGRKRVYACLLVFAGAFLMSLVGAWA